jgi:26S proteasome regulatory subunit N1
MLKKGEENNLDWIYKNKDSGQVAAAASLGMLLLWNIDSGFEILDKYMEQPNDLIRAGAYMAVGLVNSGIRNTNDPVYALLSEGLQKENETEKIGALMGLAFTYAGSNRQDIITDIHDLILDLNNSIEICAIATLTVGLIGVGTMNGESIETFVTALMTRDKSDLDNPYARYIALALGLLFFGQ